MMESYYSAQNNYGRFYPKMGKYGWWFIYLLCKYYMIHYTTKTQGWKKNSCTVHIAMAHIILNGTIEIFSIIRLKQTAIQSLICL